MTETERTDDRGAAKTRAVRAPAPRSTSCRAWSGPSPKAAWSSRPSAAWTSSSTAARWSRSRDRAARARPRCCSCSGALDSPTGGSIRFAGRDLAGLSDKQLTKIRAEEIGFVFQHFNLIPTLTAEENVAIAMFPNHVRSHERAGARQGAAEPGRARPPARPSALATVRRRAAARRDRPGACEQPERHHRRRADGQPRLRDRQGGHGDLDRPSRERRGDDRDRDPRRGRRPAHRPPGPHPRRCDPRGLLPPELAGVARDCPHSLRLIHTEACVGSTARLTASSRSVRTVSISTASRSRAVKPRRSPRRRSGRG